MGSAAPGPSTEMLPPDAVFSISAATYTGGVRVFSLPHSVHVSLRDLPPTEQIGVVTSFPTISVISGLTSVG